MRNLIFIFLLTLFLIACKNTPTDIPKDEPRRATEETKDSSTQTHKHSNETEAIELNAGAKWIVVPAMMKYIRTMESDVNRFGKKQHTELEDYTRLGISLQKNIDKLTSGCTMEGKAHDELHKWLLPYIDLVEKLSKSPSLDSAQSTYAEIQASFTVMNTYFQ